LTFVSLAVTEQVDDVSSVPVKRVHSRHRRFIAPGAVWDVLVGVELIGADYELRYNLVIHYRMDYLFGGTAALAAAIQSANAAATAANAASAATLAALGRKKRRLATIFFFFLNTRA
jgi:hypothetical protein